LGEGGFEWMIIYPVDRWRSVCVNIAPNYEADFRTTCASNDFRDGAHCKDNGDAA